jgi:hypothetical protein
MQAGFSPRIVRTSDFGHASRAKGMVRPGACRPELTARRLLSCPSRNSVGHGDWRARECNGKFRPNPRGAGVKQDEAEV